VDEARWCIDYYRRLQRPGGGVSVGMFEESYPKIGWTSVTDPMKRYVYAEDPQATYRYAAAACHLAWCLRKAGKDADAAEYVVSARRAWDWAGKNLRNGDEAKVRDDRFHAAAALYRATGEAPFLRAFEQDLQISAPDTMLSEWNQRDQQMGVWTFLLTDTTGKPGPGADPALTDRCDSGASLCEHTDGRNGGAARGTVRLRLVRPDVVGFGDGPEDAARRGRLQAVGRGEYLAVQYTTCDYMLGGNPLNMVWATGLGKRHPRQVMHWDSWYRPSPAPGIVPMGPFRYVPDAAKGPWEPAFAQATCYPGAKEWPAHELFFENRLCPPTNEFTVGSLAEAAAGVWPALRARPEGEPLGGQRRRSAEPATARGSRSLCPALCPA
jgi:hypothetical protein